MNNKKNIKINYSNNMIKNHLIHIISLLIKIGKIYQIILILKIH